MDPRACVQRTRTVNVRRRRSLRATERPQTTDRDRGCYARPIPITALLLALLAAPTAGCALDGENDSTALRPTGSAGLEWRLPARWHPIRGRASGVVEPRQVLAAASVPLRPGPPNGGCSPDSLLLKLPPDQAAIEIVEATMEPGDASHPNLHRYPPRPDPFRLDPQSYASYECNGPSYNIAFRDHGRAFQAFVWLDPKQVDPRVRRQTVALLDSLRVSR